MPPEGVVLFALYQQRLYRVLARDTKLAAATLPQLVPSLRKVSADLLAAHRELYRLTPPLKSHTTIRVGRAPPAATLLRYYREAGRASVFRGMCSRQSTSSSRSSGSCATRARQGRRDRCSSCRRPGGNTVSGATSTILTTRSSAPPTTYMRRERRAVSGVRCTHTTRRTHTSMRCSATRGECVRTEGCSTSCTTGRSSSRQHTATNGSRGRACLETDVSAEPTRPLGQHRKRCLGPNSQFADTAESQPPVDALAFPARRKDRG